MTRKKDEEEEEEDEDEEEEEEDKAKDKDDHEDSTHMHAIFVADVMDHDSNCRRVSTRSLDENRSRRVRTRSPPEAGRYQPNEDEGEVEYTRKPNTYMANQITRKNR